MPIRHLAPTASGEDIAAVLASDGVVVVETSNTTPTAFTIGQIRVARATGLPCEVEAC